MKQLFLDYHKNYIAAIKVENNSLSDYFAVSRDNIVSNIYIGRVENVRGDQCFVNFDTQRKNGILELKKKSYKSGDYIRCQVKRDENGDKGAILTDEITLAGKYAVLVEDMKGYKFSHRLQKDQVNELKEVLPNMPDQGFIIRKDAIHASLLTVSEEVNDLIKQYNDLANNSASGIKCIYHKNLTELALNETDSFGCEIIASSQEATEVIDNVTLYDGIKPMQDYYGLRERIEQLFARKIKLHNGSELVFDDTEAMTVVDVNARGYTGDISALNNSASEEILKQIKLRNISGLIMIDFVSCHDNEKLVELMNSQLRSDKERARAIGINEYSLVAINRKKRYNSYKMLFYECCEKCNKGLVEKEWYTCQKICEAVLNLYCQKAYKSLIISLNKNLLNEIKDSARYYLKNLMKQAKIYIKEYKGNEKYTLTITEDSDQTSGAYLLQEVQ